jgi:DoxX-like family
MKRNKIIFWITTVIVSAMMLYSAFNYLTNEVMKGAFVHLGFPSYFRIELAVAKILGAIVLILPLILGRLKEFAYFGFAITFISAFIAHISSGDHFSVAVAPLVFLGILATSYWHFRRIVLTQQVN